MLKHNFKAESSDHYETPMQAYRHIERVLNRIAKVARKSKESFTIYDPYFCDGKVIKNFKTLGWSKVVNVNKDFYKDIQEGTLPKYDVLVTNPPYSFDHIEKILSFCQKNRHCKCFALLLPNYSYRSRFFKEYFDSNFSEGISYKPFFIAPVERYVYCRPMSCETSKFIEKETRDYITSAKGQHSPFLSSWLVYCHTDTERIFSELLVEEKMHKDFVVARTHKGCKWKLKKRSGSRGKKRNRDNKNVIRTNVQQDRWSSAGLVQKHSRKRKKGKK